MTLVAHHLDRPRAFAELRRVLVADGRVALGTFDPESFEGYYLNRYFPSFLEIDQTRFPTAGALEADFAGAGFARRLRHRPRRRCAPAGARRRSRRSAAGTSRRSS